MTQEDFEFLTILKAKWEATKRTGSRSIMTAEDVANANDVHMRIFGSAIRPCSSCFVDSMHSLIIQRDLYEETLFEMAHQLSQQPTEQPIANEEPTTTNRRNKKKS
jgi:hypothetical protein